MSVIERFVEAQKHTKAMSHVMPRFAFQQQTTRSRSSSTAMSVPECAGKYSRNMRWLLSITEHRYALQWRGAVSNIASKCLGSEMGVELTLGR